MTDRQRQNDRNEQNALVQGLATENHITKQNVIDRKISRIRTKWAMFNQRTTIKVNLCQRKEDKNKSIRGSQVDERE